jgi:hypothetical protein
MCKNDIVQVKMSVSILYSGGGDGHGREGHRRLRKGQHVTAGPLGPRLERLRSSILHLFAALAEKERAMISSRTESGAGGCEGAWGGVG